MLSNSLGRIFSAVVCVSCMALAAAAQYDAETVKNAYDRMRPALCIVSYTAEVTNPTTGASQRGKARSLGIIVRSDGLVLVNGRLKTNTVQTSNHRVLVGDGADQREYAAELLKKPDDVNICFLRIQPEEPVTFPVTAFSRAPLALGDQVMLMGVLGESFDFEPVAMVRRIGAILDEPRLTYCLDESVKFGSVGGPVINAAGEAVGVVGFDLSPLEGGELYVRQGHPLVYQTELFDAFIQTPPGLPEEGEEDESAGWLGVFTQPLTDDLAEYWGLERRGGVIVSTIVPDSPAEAAGFQRGDVIVQFGDTPITARQDQDVLAFTKLIQDTGAGVVVPVKYLRNGELLEVPVTLVARPKSAREANEYADETFGVTVREITTDVRILLNLPEDVAGVMVQRTESGSAAELARMQPGMIILNFGGHPVANISEFKEAVAEVAAERPNEVPVFVTFRGQTGFLRLQPRW